MNAGMPHRPDAMPLEDRKAVLARAYGHGQAIHELAVIGASYAALGRYVAVSDDLAENANEHGKRLSFADVVTWDVTLDNDQTILGFSQSGYGPLMEQLGIDFSGAPYEAGN